MKIKRTFHFNRNESKLKAVYVPPLRVGGRAPAPTKQLQFEPVAGPLRHLQRAKPGGPVGRRPPTPLDVPLSTPQNTRRALRLTHHPAKAKRRAPRLANLHTPSLHRPAHLSTLRP